MVKTLPERVRTRVHHTISPSQTQKSAPPATTPRGDKKSDDDSIAKREREREREKQKKSAHLLLVTTRIGRHYIRGLDVLWIPIRTNYNVVKIQRVVVLSSFESAKEL
tara:strand:- start:71 stop:394 length:324 start_codon:yes stop_codon:yes gene_type:complete